MSKATLDDIKPDSFIGTAAVPQPDGTLKALEVHAVRRQPARHRRRHSAWESADGKVDTMHQCTVGNQKSNVPRPDRHLRQPAENRRRAGRRADRDAGSGRFEPAEAGRAHRAVLRRHRAGDASPPAICFGKDGTQN
ncbi:hypothetical protein NFX37_08475 [Serratia marcescens]|nr:hypothetical protein NFX37_08475 [Serratia marcescens]